MHSQHKRTDTMYIHLVLASYQKRKACAAEHHDGSFVHRSSLGGGAGWPQSEHLRQDRQERGTAETEEAAEAEGEGVAY